MQQHLMAFVNTLGIMAFCTVLFSVIQSHIGDEHLRRLSLGFTFGAAGVVTMLQPLELTPGTFADARGAFIGMAMAFGGPLAAFVAVAVTMTASVTIGADGLHWGMWVIGATAIASGVWFYANQDQEKRALRDWVLLSVACSAPTYLTLQLITAINSQVMLFSVFLIGMLIFGFAKMLETEQRRGSRERDLAFAATTDILTGLPNRRALEDYVRHLENAGCVDVMLLLLDVDHFKKINDEFGHDVGDTVLRDIASAIKGAIREGDFAARIGGEEFAVIVRANDASTGYHVAERFRKAVQVPFGDPSNPRVSTISVGGFCFNGKPFSYIAGYEQADKALYKSKAKGRNRATVAPHFQAA